MKYDFTHFTDELSKIKLSDEFKDTVDEYVNNLINNDKYIIIP